MHSLSDTRWRNAAYDGTVEFVVKVVVPREERPGSRLRDEPDVTVTTLASAIQSNLEACGYVARVEHRRYPG